MICLLIIGGILLAIVVVALGLLALVVKAQQHEPGIE